MRAEVLQAVPETSQDMFGLNTSFTTDCFSLGIDPQQTSMISMDSLLNVDTMVPVDNNILIFADEKAKREQPRDDFAVVRQLMSQYQNSADFFNSSQELYQRALEIQNACCPPGATTNPFSSGEAFSVTLVNPMTALSEDFCLDDHEDDECTCDSKGKTACKKHRKTAEKKAA